MMEQRKGMKIGLPVLPVVADDLVALIETRIQHLRYLDTDGVSVLFGEKDSTSSALAWVLALNAAGERSIAPEFLIFPDGYEEAQDLLLLLAWLFPAVESPIMYIVDYLLSDEQTPETDEVRPVPPEKPTLTGEGSEDAWFRWYHAMSEAGFKVTLNDVAIGTGYASSTIKDKHALWKQDKEGY
jgi:hypothetical protein